MPYVCVVNGRRKDVSLMFNRDITLEEMIDIRGREQWDKGKQEGILEGKIRAYHDCGLPPKEIASGLGNSLSPNFRSFFMFFFFAFLHIPENIFVKFSKKY